ncbi:hypothetical protein [Micromonospora sp. CA-246542]|uniref:hypothetical protein n=1 Tax=Micromonospora sp. CA-246542 TaxID=3239959 RepID=UPI003D90A0B2
MTDAYDIPADAYALVGGKPLAIFLAETSRTAVAKVGRHDLFEDVHHELWAFALSRPDLTDRETIRAHHRVTGAKVDDPEQNYSAAKVLKLEGQQIAQRMASEGIERRTEERYAGKDVARLLKPWSGIPADVQQALTSDRLPSQWREALERRYRDGESAKAVGEKTLQRARDRVAEVLNSGVTTEAHWGPQRRSDVAPRIDAETEDFVDAFLMGDEPSEGAFAASDGLGTSYNAEAATGLYEGSQGSTGALTVTSTDEQVTAYLCGPSPMSARTAAERLAWLRRYYDLEPDLYIYGITGRFTTPALEFLVTELPEEERHALWVRYCPEVDGKTKRGLEYEGIYVLNKLRMSMGQQVGKGMAK